MGAIGELQSEVQARLRSGEPFAQIEQDVIEPADLPEEYKSALWLYGWASLDRGRLRSRNVETPSVANGRPRATSYFPGGSS